MVDELFGEARRGNRGAVSMLLNRHRARLRAWAARAIQSRGVAESDPSVFVQRTLHQAHDQFAEFCGETDAEWMDWLRLILERHVGGTISEVAESSEQSVSQPAARQDGEQATKLDEPTGVMPSGVLDTPSSDRLELAISCLPVAQGQVVRLRQIRGWTLTRIAEHIGLDEVIVAGLLRTGLRRLRERIDSPDRDEQ